MVGEGGNEWMNDMIMLCGVGGVELCSCFLLMIVFESLWP